MHINFFFGSRESHLPATEHGYLMTFMDHTRAFDLVNREAPINVLKKVGCPPILLDLIKSFQTVQTLFKSMTLVSESFVNAVLAPTLFGGIFREQRRANIIIRTRNHRRFMVEMKLGINVVSFSEG